MKRTKLRGLKSSVYDRRRERRKRERNLCIRKHCQRRPRRNRRVCDTCESREKFAKFPLLRLFHNLKSAARRRRIPFALPFAWFCAAATASGYATNHGQSATALTVDRIDSRRGYVPDNIQFLTHAENSRKGWYERHGKPWEQAQGSDDDMKKNDSKRVRDTLISELWEATGVTSHAELLNILCEQGRASDSVERLNDVSDADLLRALNSYRKAA